jgi:hypothetical protein
MMNGTPPDAALRAASPHWGAHVRFGAAARVVPGPLPLQALRMR